MAHIRSRFDLVICTSTDIDWGLPIWREKEGRGRGGEGRGGEGREGEGREGEGREGEGRGGEGRGGKEVEGEGRGGEGRREGITEHLECVKKQSIIESRLATLVAQTSCQACSS